MRIWKDGGCNAKVVCIKLKNVIELLHTICKVKRN